MPDATFAYMGKDGPSHITTSDICAGGKTVVIFALPGAFTGTCSTIHMPSFIRTADAFRAKGVDGIYCITPNDIFVNNEWDKITGAGAAGVQILCDAGSAYTKASGYIFSIPAVGLVDRPMRLAMIVRDGVIAHIRIDEDPSTCDLSAGEAILELL